MIKFCKPIKHIGIVYRGNHMKVFKSILDTVGSTPLVELVNLEKKYQLKARILAKVEFFNPLKWGESLLEQLLQMFPSAIFLFPRRPILSPHISQYFFFKKTHFVPPDLFVVLKITDKIKTMFPIIIIQSVDYNVKN